MLNKSRMWVLMGFLGLIAIGATLTAALLLAPAKAPGTAMPASRAVTSDVPYPNVPRVSVSDARMAYDTKQVVFVDVRSAGEYAQSHIPGAMSIPPNELDSRLNELNKDQRIIAYCT